MKDETTTVDDIECVYCGHIFNGNEACNYDLSCQSVECPECGKEMFISISPQFTCRPVDL